MRHATRILTLCLAGLVALAAPAQADPCPECDEDGPGAQTSYHDLDVGVIENETHALVDSDFSYADREESGFFTWWSICLDAIVQEINDLTGLDLGAKGHAEAYVSEEGVDIDANFTTPAGDVDFDDSPLGDLDGATWEAMQDVDVPKDRPHLDDVARVPDTFVNVCIIGTDVVVECQLG